MKKERFVDWWKQDKRYMTLLKSGTDGTASPALLSGTDGSGRKKHRTGVSSLFGMNDELFYFKQVEES